MSATILPGRVVYAPLAFGVYLLTAAAALGQTPDCALRWDPNFANPGMNSNVGALEAFNDGTGPALFAGGSFVAAPGGVAANRIAKFDGTGWSPLGTGISGAGTPEVFALTVWNNRLYAAGTFTSAGGVPANRIASWNGAAFAALGTGISSTVFSLAGSDAASPVGPALYAGGAFNTAGGVTVNSIAKWDGVTWSAIGSGTLAVDDTIGTVNSLLVFNNNLYAGGAFNRVNGQVVNYIARWDGVNWFSLGSGMGGEVFPNVLSLAVFNGQLHAGGNFTTAGGVPANYVARWDGNAWSALGTGTGGLPNLRSVAALTVFDDTTGSGSALYVGGRFVTAGGMVVNKIARWNGAAWSSLANGMNSDVQSLQEFGTALYAGGLFTTAGGRTSQRIARWRCIPLEDEACCLIDGSCQDVNFTECTAIGGLAQGEGTTCATANCPQPPMACCFSDGTCRDITEQQCRGTGGTPQAFGTLCSQTQCPQQQACCFTDGRCLDLLAADCSQQGGAPQGAGTTCAANGCPQACCLSNNSCQSLRPEDCISQGGSPQGVSTTCSTAECPQACCLPNNTCSNLRAAACLAQGGTAQGPASNCATAVCPQACCLPNNSCGHLLAAACTAQGGTPQGLASTCQTAQCPQACCLPDNSCQNLLRANCTSQNGTPQGVGSNCATATCPQACCLPGGLCENLLAPACRARGGEPQGTGTNCATADCGEPLGACCLPSSSLFLDWETDAAGNPLPAGTIITNQYDAWGVHVTVNNLVSNHPDKAIIFDTANPTGGDDDLRTPGYHPTNTVPYGNVLIMAENDRDQNNDGLVDDPDDEGGHPAGTINIRFDSIYDSAEIVLVDAENSEPHFIIFRRNGAPASQIPIGTEDNGVIHVSLMNTEFNEIEWDAGGSGSIAEVRVGGGRQCREVTATECQSIGGSYQGDNTDCDSANCLQACCFQDSTCTDLPEPICRAQGGTPQGGGSSCAAGGCQQACCLPDGSCLSLTLAECRNRGGDPRGAGSSCTNVVCDEPQGACCIDSNTLTLNWETNSAGIALPAGTVITNQYAPWGVTITTNNNVHSHPDKAIIFDSANPTGGDPDLETPGYHPSNTAPYGNLLIIAENDRDQNADGLVDDPDDEGSRPAGWINFAFDAVYNYAEIVMVDAEAAEPHNLEFKRLGVRVGLIPVDTADNGVIVVTLSNTEFDEIRWNAGGSGAIGEIRLRGTERCIVTTRTACIQDGGVYQGDNTQCSGNFCTGIPRDSNLFVDANEPGVYVHIDSGDLRTGGGFTAFDRYYEVGTNLNIAALEMVGGKPFLNWTVDGVEQTAQQSAIQLTIAGEHHLMATYATFRDCNRNGIDDKEDPIRYPMEQYVQLFAASMLEENPDSVNVCLFDFNDDGVLNGADLPLFLTELLGR